MVYQHNKTVAVSASANRDITDQIEEAINAVKVEEYDTDDGWYVRKWPDGYCELIYSAPIDFAEWAEWNAPIYQAKNADGTFGFGNIPLPITIVERLYETGNVYLKGNYSITYASTSDDYRLTTTYRYNAIRIGTVGPLSGKLNIFIAAKWKASNAASYSVPNEDPRQW